MILNLLNSEYNQKRGYDLLIDDLGKETIETHNDLLVQGNLILLDSDFTRNITVQNETGSEKSIIGCGTINVTGFIQAPLLYEHNTRPLYGFTQEVEDDLDTIVQGNEVLNNNSIIPFVDKFKERENEIDNHKSRIITLEKQIIPQGIIPIGGAPVGYTLDTSSETCDVTRPGWYLIILVGSGGTGINTSAYKCSGGGGGVITTVYHLEAKTYRCTLNDGTVTFEYNNETLRATSSKLGWNSSNQLYFSGGYGEYLIDDEIKASTQEYGEALVRYNNIYLSSGSSGSQRVNASNLTTYYAVAGGVQILLPGLTLQEPTLVWSYSNGSSYTIGAVYLPNSILGYGYGATCYVSTTSGSYNLSTYGPAGIILIPLLYDI